MQNSLNLSVFLQRIAQSSALATFSSLSSVSFIATKSRSRLPVSFGMEVVDGKCAIYFHCGKKGMKVELLKANPNVCVEADIHYAYELLKRGIDTRYESVIGFGKCTEVEGDEKLHGLELLCEHCGYAGHPVDACLGLPITSVYKVEVDEITGKRTLPEYWKQSGEGTPCLDE